MEAGNDEAHRSAGIDFRFEREHQVNVAGAGFRLLIDRLAIERTGGVRIPLAERHDDVRALVGQRPVVVRVLAALSGLLFRARAQR